MKAAHHRKGTAAVLLFLFRSGAAFSSNTATGSSEAVHVAFHAARRGIRHRGGFSLFAERNDASEEAARLLAKAREIRESIPEQQPEAADDQTASSATTAAGYRLYCDLGREDGTWMDPRWGASGKRIEFTLDVEFDISLANDAICLKMVKDNFGGKSSAVRTVKSLKSARLRGGFDKMQCYGGGYRIDVGGGNSVCRFFVECEGTPERGGTFGDVWVPQGCLYFSIPSFGNTVSNLSAKECPITVRQIGWHTGWRREESRIVGIFRAKKLEDARRIDKY
mmetsp:Transcript_13266/g.22077  ORF Transcript_13266/g.22077 Transcript_13266/m.22077 type:complete len:280 (-) Transcript_13266:33-872(-)